MYVWCLAYKLKGAFAYFGSLMMASKDMSTFLIPEPVNATLYWKRVFADVIKLRILG